MRPHLVILGILVVGASPAGAGPLTPTAEEKSALEALGKRIPDARLIWVRGARLYHSKLQSFKPQRVTQGTTEEDWPRWSPDGSRVLYIKQDGTWVTDASFNGHKRLIPFAYPATWTRDGASIVAIANYGYWVVRHDLAADQTTVIYDSSKAPSPHRQKIREAELRVGGRFLLTFWMASQTNHVTEIVDLETGTYINNKQMQRGDCSPAWTPDGTHVISTANLKTRPVLKASFSPEGMVSPSKHFVGLKTSESYDLHGEQITQDGKWMVFMGNIHAGPKATGKNEIYIWRVGEPEDKAVRVTFDTAEDLWPTLHVPLSETEAPELALSPAKLAFTSSSWLPPSPRKVVVYNRGGKVLSPLQTRMTYHSGSGWLRLTRTGSGNHQAVVNEVDAEGLAPGSYSAEVEVLTGPDTDPVRYEVTLDVKVGLMQPGAGAKGFIAHGHPLEEEGGGCSVTPAASPVSPVFFVILLLALLGLGRRSREQSSP
jgi:MYXO-CTERM domain-containing protein